MEVGLLVGVVSEGCENEAAAGLEGEMRSCGEVRLPRRWVAELEGSPVCVCVCV